VAGDLRLGDGTSASGFHPTNSNIVFASFQNQFFFSPTSTGAPGESGCGRSRRCRSCSPASKGAPRSWWSGRQFISFDPVHPDAQYTGYAHVWRTLDNGGDQAFLEANCTVFQAFFIGTNAICGDWTPLGPALNDAVSGFGTDRSGGIVVAAQRSAGRLRHALGSDQCRSPVRKSQRRYCQSCQRDPSRASTRATSPRLNASSAESRPIQPIANRAWIAYSGFNALTPATPGHVFEVTWDPANMSSNWTSLDFDPRRPAGQSSGARCEDRRPVHGDGFRRSGAGTRQLALARGGRRIADPPDPVPRDPSGAARLLFRGDARSRRLVSTSAIKRNRC